MKLMAVVHKTHIILYKTFSRVGCHLHEAHIMSGLRGISTVGSEWLLVLDDGSYLYADLIQRGTDL